MESVLRDIESFEEEFERVLKEATERGEVEVKKYGPYVYGFSITIGPDGKPIIREFGNIRRSVSGAKIEEEFEPFVDIMEDDENIVVVVELPGVSKDKIKVKASENYIEVKASNGKKYYKRIRMPEKIDPKSVRAKYNNGVLEIVVEKKENLPTTEKMCPKCGNQEAYFWATHAGAELDLLVFIDGQPVGFEIKRTVTPRLTPSMRTSLVDLNLKQLFVIHAGEHAFSLHERVYAVPMRQLRQHLEQL
jgi:HSP20 family protein